MEELGEGEVDQDLDDGPPSGYGTSPFGSQNPSDPSPPTWDEEETNEEEPDEPEPDDQEAQPQPVTPPTTATADDEIVSEGDDSFYGGHPVKPKPTESILISDLLVTSVKEAREIANVILDELEMDVQAYFDKWGDDVPSWGNNETSTTPGPDRVLQQLARKTSTISIGTTFSLPELGEPSTLKLWYERGEPDFRTTSIPRIPLEAQVDQSCEADLHRTMKKFGIYLPPKLYEDFTQTRELAFVSHFRADQLFRRLYPEKDNYRPPPTPARKASLEGLLEEADEAGDVDKGRIGPKVKWSKRKRLLPPLPENYSRGETFWTGSIYRGEYLSRQFNHGNYNYPLMSTYESEFKEGHAHSKKHLGLVVYPRGDSFEGQWRKGRFMSGNITFGDELEFEPQGWSYCVPPDRRFYIERDVGMKQAGRTLYNDRLPPPQLPPGTYDTGDGIYNPSTGVVNGFNGQKLRDASASEREWILANCWKSKTVEERYVPSFSVDRLPCSYAGKYVKQ